MKVQAGVRALFLVFLYLQGTKLAKAMNNCVITLQTAPSQSTAAPANGAPTANGPTSIDEMTSKDYYFDSYAHFGIHEVSILYVLT